MQRSAWSLKRSSGCSGSSSGMGPVHSNRWAGAAFSAHAALQKHSPHPPVHHTTPASASWADTVCAMPGPLDSSAAPSCPALEPLGPALEQLASEAREQRPASSASCAVGGPTGAKQRGFPHASTCRREAGVCSPSDGSSRSTMSPEKKSWVDTTPSPKCTRCTRTAPPHWLASINRSVIATLSPERSSGNSRASRAC